MHLGILDVAGVFSCTRQAAPGKSKEPLLAEEIVRQKGKESLLVTKSAVCSVVLHVWPIPLAVVVSVFPRIGLLGVLKKIVCSRCARLTPKIFPTSSS